MCTYRQSNFQTVVNRHFFILVAPVVKHALDYTDGLLPHKPVVLLLNDFSKLGFIL